MVFEAGHGKIRDVPARHGACSGGPSLYLAATVAVPRVYVSQPPQPPSRDALLRQNTNKKILLIDMFKMDTELEDAAYSRSCDSPLYGMHVFEKHAQSLC